MLIDRNDTPAPTVATTFSERRKAGFLVATQEEVRIAVKVLYIVEYNEPVEEEWASIITFSKVVWDSGGRRYNLSLKSAEIE
jgi:hypothetical protein